MSREDDILQRASKVGWHELSDDELEDVARIPSMESMIPPAESRGGRGTLPADVRAEIREGGGDGRMISRELGDGNVTLLVTPPDERGWTEIQGRLWLPEFPATPVRVVLSQEDHVLALHELDDSHGFRFLEPVEGDWELEFHLDAGSTLVLRGHSR